MAFVEPMVRRCIEYKLGVVSDDERDYGRRAVLNLGHSVGHGIETAGNYTAYSHGQAVALGLLAAVRISEAGSLPCRGLLRRGWNRCWSCWVCRRGWRASIRRRSSPPCPATRRPTIFPPTWCCSKTIGEPVINCDVDAAMLRREVERLVSELRVS